MATAFARRFEREVGATPAEFLRGLSLAHSKILQEADGTLRLTDGAVCLAIRLVQQPSRKLGLFDLPVLHVTYDFESGEAQGCQAFLARLDLAMQRGGG